MRCHVLDHLKGCNCEVWRALHQELGSILSQVWPDFSDFVKCEAARPGNRGNMMREVYSVIDCEVSCYRGTCYVSQHFSTEVGQFGVRYLMSEYSFMRRGKGPFGSKCVFC